MNEFGYKIVRSGRRRTVSVQVAPDNTVSVLVPRKLSQKRIEEIVERKRKWILEKLRFNSEVRRLHKPKEYVSGEAFAYLGRNYRLKVLNGKPDGVSLKNGRFYVHTAKEDGERAEYVRRQLVDWYSAHAREKLRERVEYHADRIGADYAQVKVKYMKSQWGSCSHIGNINLNWRIIMAPISIVDYVVVHELCHRQNPNHSPRFWRDVQRIIPDYKERKHWLRIHGALLVV